VGQPPTEQPAAEQASAVPADLSLDCLKVIPSPASGLRRVTHVLEGLQHFKTAAPRSGTVNPKALVCLIEREPLKIAVAIDSAKADSPHYDVLRLDPTGKGNFTDAVALARESFFFDAPLNQYSYRFEQPTVELKFPDRTLQVEVTSVFRDRPGFRSLWIRFSANAVGNCRFGDKVHQIRFFDGNTNLRFGDPSTPAAALGNESLDAVGDSFAVDLEESGFKHEALAFYGHPVLVDGAIYDVMISPDGQTVSAQPYTGPVGLLRVNHASWRARLVNNDHVYIAHGGTDPVPVPAGRYRLLRYEEWLSVDWKKPRDVLILGELRDGAPQEPLVEITPNTIADLAVGSPIRVRLSATPEGGKVRFEVSQDDVAGRHSVVVDTERATSWNPQVTLTVSDSSGKPVGRITRYLLDLEREGWKIPYGLTGTFRASLEFPSDTFRVECEPVTFTVE
jgi:hypothetical protein